MKLIKAKKITQKLRSNDPMPVNSYGAETNRRWCECLAASSKGKFVFKEETRKDGVKMCWVERAGL